MRYRRARFAGWPSIDKRWPVADLRNEHAAIFEPGIRTTRAGASGGRRAGDGVAEGEVR